MQNDISPMNHDKAVAERLADRYLLQELSAVETEEFERHYFECAECAAAVESGHVFVANAREVLRESPATVRAKSERTFFGIRWTWSGMLMPATAFALALVAMYQGAVVIPRLKQPRVLPAFQLLGASRGQEDARIVPKSATAFAISADVPPDAHYPTYSCELKSGGRSVFAVEAAAPQPGQPITIFVPAEGLASGSYEFTVRGGTEKVFSSAFEIRFE